MKLTTILIIGVFVLLTGTLVLYYTPGSATARPHSYADGLTGMKSWYWNQAWRSGCGPQVVRIFDALISDLIAAGESAPEEGKQACFRRADAALHELYRTRRPIESNEAVQLWRIGDLIALSVGMKAEEHGVRKKYITIEQE
jgi:hypothetical protein